MQLGDRSMTPSRQFQLPVLHATIVQEGHNVAVRSAATMDLQLPMDCKGTIGNAREQLMESVKDAALWL